MGLIKSCFDNASEEELMNMTSPLAVIIAKGYKPKIVFSHALPLKLTYDKDMETFLKLHGLWNWKIDKKMDIKRIEMSPEMTAAYKKSLLQTFKAFDCFCRKHGITYYAGGGTLIGAVRHKGIIPWDDDIDVLMLKEDYDRFIALKQECSNSDYRILDYHDRGYYLPYAKYVDANTTIWEVKELPYVIGTFIDVFPLYHSAGDINEVQHQVCQYKKTFLNYFLGIRTYSIIELLGNIKERHLQNVLDWFKGVFYCKRKVNSLFEKFSSLEQNFSALQEGEYLIHYYTTYSIKQELYKKNGSKVW